MSRTLPPLDNSVNTGNTTKWKRLVEMRPRELVYRLYKEAIFRFDKWRWQNERSEICDEELLHAFGLDWNEDSPELSYQALRRYLSDTVANRFYFRPAQRSKIVQLVKERFPHWIKTMCAQADKICQHRFQLLALDELYLGEQINWHRDPETNNCWSQRHWIDMRLLMPQTAADPKVIWELNRHQQLLWLGVAYCYSGNESYVNEYLSQLESWLQQNPYQLGINWASSLEIAFRTINWFWALLLFIDSPRLHNKFLIHIVNSLVQHLTAIYRNPSIYSSPNTHLIGEACALYIGGLLFAEHRAAKRWRDFGRRILRAEIERQLYADGGHKEQSAYYHCYTIEFYLLALLLARRNGEPRDDVIQERLERACEYLMQICQPSRELTAFGDEDGGRILMIGTHSYRYPKDLLAIAAIYFARSDFKYMAGEFQEAALWLLGPSALSRFEMLTAAPPKYTSVCLRDSGHVALRADWSPYANYLLFHCPQHTHLPGHSHADCLSFELSSGGSKRIIDSGTYRYNNGLAARNYFRGTSAHNTICIDGVEQSWPGDVFKWRRQAEARLLQTVFSSMVDYVIGEHNGYLSLPSPCLHRRAILFARPYYFIVWDELIGTDRHECESFFHFGAAQIEQDQSGWLLVSYQDGLRLLIAPLASIPLEVDTITVDEETGKGWCSPGYGRKEPCLSLRLRQQTALPMTILTLLFPYQAEPPIVESYKLSIPNSLGLRVITKASDDIIIYSPCSTEIKNLFGQINFVGERLWLHTDKERLCGALAINARLLEYDRQRIFRVAQALPHFVWEEAVSHKQQ
ncbi:MAG: alginate lyase family protein [Acidobacteriota bacterium]